MDLTNIGLEALLIAAIIAASKVITAVFDPKLTLERWYPLLPVIVAIPVAILRFWDKGPLAVALNVIIYGFIAGHAYKTGKTTILGQ